MADFAFSDDDRQKWAEDAAAAMVGLSAVLRKRMLDNIGVALPAKPSDVFDPQWWEDGLNGPVADQFAAIASDAAGKFHEGAGWGPIPTALAVTVGASVAAGMIGVMGGRGEIVSNRVEELVVQGQETNLAIQAGESSAQERNGEWLSSQLALDADEGGPLSDKLMDNFGRDAMTSMSGMAAESVLDEYDVSVPRRWRAVFINTRIDHADANGDIAAAGEPFDIGGNDGFFPGDPMLPDDQVCGCQCYLEYIDLPDEVPSNGDGDAVPSEDMPESFALSKPNESWVYDTGPVNVHLSETFALNKVTARASWEARIPAVSRLSATFADAVPAPVADAPDAEIAADPEAVAGTDQPDYSDSVCVTIEPTAAEKQLLAVPDGLEASDLHVTLAYLGKMADLDDAARLTISTVLGQVAEVTSPFEGDVAGIGWFGDVNAITIALIDGEGLAALRTAIVDLLIGAGVPIDEDHDFVPHATLGYSQLDAADKVGMPLHFNELRLRWGVETLAFDLMGPIETAPEQPVLVPEVAPAPDNPSPVEAPMTVTETFADPATSEPLPGDVPLPGADAAPPADLSTVPSEILVAEMARRAADQVVAEVGAQTGTEATADQVATAAAATEEEAAEIMDDLTDAAEAALGLVDPDATPGEDDGEDTEPGAPSPAIAASNRSRETKSRVIPAFTLAADLTAVTDDDLTAEIAKRAADKAIADLVAVSGTDPDPLLAEQVQAAAQSEAADVWDDMADALADVTGVENDDGQDGMMPDGESVDVPFNLRSGPIVMRGPQMGPNRLEVRTIDMSGAPQGTSWTFDGGTITLTGNGTVVTDAAPDAAVVDTGRPFAVEGNPPAPEGVEYEWEGILCVEGVPTDDGRMMGEGSISWRQLPLPLTFLDKITSAHQLGEKAGTIHAVERRGSAIWGMGTFDDNEAGNKLRAYLTDPKGMGRYGVSADIGGATTVFSTDDGQILDPMEAQDAYYAGEHVVELMTSGTLMGATGVLHPALMEANIWMIQSSADEMANPDDAVIASGPGTTWRTMWNAELRPFGEPAVVASGDALPTPPKHLFGLRADTTPEPFTVEAPLPDGTIPVYGLLAEKGTCHTMTSRECIRVPASNDFRSFYTGKKILTAEGELLPVGPIIMDTVHPNKLWNASDTQAFYADTGCAVADVRLYRTKFGIVAAGVLSPFATPAQVYRLRASDVSPDWRSLLSENGRKEHKIVAVLAVPCSGFVVEGSEALVASGANGEPPANGVHVQTLVSELIDTERRLTAAEAHLGALTDYVTSISSSLNRKEAEEAFALLTADEPLVVSRKRSAAHAVRVLGLSDAGCSCGDVCACQS